MENNNNPSLDNIFNLSIDTTAMNHLRVAATWARIIAIIAFIGVGISLLASFFQPSDGAFEKTGTIIGTMIVGAINIFINIYLYRFATQTSIGLSGMNQVSVTSGINNLRVYFKILGICLIIFLSLMVLGMLFFMMGLAMR